MILLSCDKRLTLST